MWGYEDNDMRVKICPLTGKEINEFEHYSCFSYKCDDAKPDKYEYIFGCRYRCGYEKQILEERHQKQLEIARRNDIMRESHDIARSIDLDEFYEYCENINIKMYENRMSYDRKMILYPYHESYEKAFIYFFEGDEVKEMSVVDNICNYIAVRFDKLRCRENNTSISIEIVPDYLADALNIYQHLKRKRDVRIILKYDNPVYIKARFIAKYLDAVYGWNWQKFTEIRAKHLELTEIANYDNVIYLKPEIDEIIRREYLMKSGK